MSGKCNTYDDYEDAVQMHMWLFDHVSEDHIRGHDYLHVIAEEWNGAQREGRPVKDPRVLALEIFPEN